jgi:type I restriction enzyme S subunit
LQRGFDLPINKRTRGRYPVVSSSGIIDHHIESKVKGPGFTVGRSGSVGKIYFVEEYYWPLNTTLFSKELNGNDPKFAFYYLSTFDFLKFSSSTAVPTLNRNNFSDVSIKVPPLSEQKEIVRIVEKLLDHEDEAKVLIDMEEQIDLLEKSILSKAFRGELGTNDPNDEPAVELLKRSLKEKLNK